MNCSSYCNRLTSFEEVRSATTVCGLIEKKITTLEEEEDAIDKKKKKKTIDEEEEEEEEGFDHDDHRSCRVERTTSVSAVQFLKRAQGFWQP